ncbi:MAG: PAS domain-containing protein [Parvibaculaceae bacterium]
MPARLAVHLLVVPPAADLEVALVIDLFRLANSLAGEDVFVVDILTPDGGPAELTNGRTLLPDSSTGNAAPDAIIVIADSRPRRALEEKAVRLLRRLARTPAQIIGIKHGALLMAQAGVLDGHRATAHFDSLPVAQETYDAIEFVEQVFVVDRKRITCGGYLAIPDMLLYLIEKNVSEAVMALLAAQLLAPGIRQPRTPQRINSYDPLSGQFDPRLKKAIELMQKNIETPLGIDEIAGKIGISVRQLQNLWQSKVGSSHNQYYIDLRLDRARSLLHHTDMSISEIALACGFSSTATFSRAFRQHDGINARSFRAHHRDALSPILQRNTVRTLSAIIDRHAGFLYRNLNDRIYTVLFVTRGIERLLGYSPSEFTGPPKRNMASIIHPDDLELMQQNVDRAVEMRQNWDIEFRYIHRNGKTVWVHEVGSGVFDPSGRLLYVEGIIVRNLNPPEQYLDTMSLD